MIRIPPITGDLVRMRQANAESAGAPLLAVPIDVEMAVLEQFPPVLRQAFNDAATKVSCLVFVEHFNWAIRNGFGPERTLRKFREMEANEVLVFAGQHMAEHRHPLPHVAAGATIQRYGAFGPSRHPPRSFGAPVIRARARKRRFRVRASGMIDRAA